MLDVQLSPPECRTVDVISSHVTVLLFLTATPAFFFHNRHSSAAHWLKKANTHRVRPTLTPPHRIQNKNPRKLLFSHFFMKHAPATVDKKVIGKSLNDEKIEEKKWSYESRRLFVGNILVD